MLYQVRENLYSQRKESLSNIIVNVLVVLIVLVFAFELMFSATYSGIYVVQNSMYPTFTGAESEDVAGGDYVYVNKSAQPTYGDVVVVIKDAETTIIKRVVAFGGDYVKLVQGKLYVKFSGQDEFTAVEEDYVSPSNNNPTMLKNTFPLKDGGVDEDGFYVDEGCMFLLGDNRDVSVDSRENGGKNYPLSSLYGVVTDWSIKHKEFFTKMHEFFSFRLPGYLGL